MFFWTKPWCVCMYIRVIKRKVLLYGSVDEKNLLTEMLILRAISKRFRIHMVTNDDQVITVGEKHRSSQVFSMLYVWVTVTMVTKNYVTTNYIEYGKGQHTYIYTNNSNLLWLVWYGSSLYVYGVAESMWIIFFLRRSYGIFLLKELQLCVLKELRHF